MFIPSYPGKKVAKPCFNSWIKIWNSLKSFQPDILHVTGDAFTEMFALVCNTLSIPIVGSFHTDLIDLLNTHHAYKAQIWIVLFMEFISYLSLDSCATTSESFLKKLTKQGLICEHIIRTSVDLNIFNPTKRSQDKRNELTFGDPNAFLCVYVGRLSREKRIDIIIDAIRKIDGVYLAIVGDGPSGTIYSKMHGKSNRLFCQPKFLNHDELAEIYASSDLHVSASEFETLGNTVLESFACGVPVVVPKTQGFCDTVSHGVDGYLFQPRDSDSARSYIEKLYLNKIERQQFQSNAIKSVENRSIQAVVHDLLIWYKKAFVPFAVTCLAGYDSVMYILMTCGYSPVENLEKKSKDL
eukprot:gene18543-24263_t